MQIDDIVEFYYMPRNALHNPMTVAALGALLERPMHPYELAKVLAESGVPVNRGSLYDTIDALARAGWVIPLKSERAGVRPKRTPYRITEDGQAELVSRLDEQLRTPRNEYPVFLSAVSHIGVLGKTRAAAALQERVTRLADRIDELARQLHDALNSARVPRLFVIEAEYALAMLRAERQWISGTIRDINDGGLAWPSTKERH